MATFAPAFGAYTFGTTPAPTAFVLEEWKDRFLVATKFTPRQAAIGQNLQSQQIKGREITCRGFMQHGSDDTAREQLDAMMAALQAGEQSFNIFTGRYIDAWLSGNVEYSPVKGSTHHRYNVSFKMQTQEPYWKSTTLTTDAFNKNGASPYTQALTINNGTTTALPTIGMTLKSASETGRTISIKNDSTGKELKLHGIDWNLNSQIVLDFERRLVHDGSDNPLFMGLQEGTWWDLLGGAAVTTLRVSHNLVAGTPNIDFLVTYKERFLVA